MSVILSVCLSVYETYRGYKYTTCRLDFKVLKAQAPVWEDWGTI